METNEEFKFPGAPKIPEELYKKIDTIEDRHRSFFEEINKGREKPVLLRHSISFYNDSLAHKDIKIRFDDYIPESIQNECLLFFENFFKEN